MSAHAFAPADREAVYRAIHTRRDTRAYLPDPVPDELLWRVLEAAHHAPSVGFMQPWNFLLVEDRSLLREVYAHVVATSEAAGRTYEGDRARTYGALKLQGILDAPRNLLVTCDPERGGNVLGRHTTRETDVYSTCLAVQNLWLAARAEGLGVGWVSIFEAPFIRRLLCMPERVIPVAWLTLGWPVELASEPMLSAVGWRRRLPLADLVLRDRWSSPAPAPGPAPVALAPTPTPEAAVHRNDQLTKPPGSLGRLEALALQVAAIQATSTPRYGRKALVLCAADHGVCAQGVSAYRPEVTARMVLQFIAGAGAVNAFARQHGVSLTVADLGVDHDFGEATGLVHAKIRRGTRDLSVEPAMSPEETSAALDAGRRLLPDCDLLGVGEMGIGNSTSAAALASALLDLPPEAVVGRGTGIGAETWARKVAAARAGLTRGGEPLSSLGGYEIAALAGLIDEAALRGVPVVLDGFITGVAALVAVRRRPAVREALIAGHRSAEAGHAAVLDALGLQPVLDLGMRLGEGSGACLALGIVESACRTLSEMRTFEEAGIRDAVHEEGRR